MGQDEKIREAQEILNWAMTYLKGSMNCKVIDYKHENYKVQFFTKENKLIMPVQVPDEWIRNTNPKENRIHEKLEILIRNLATY